MNKKRNRSSCNLILLYVFIANAKLKIYTKRVNYYRRKLWYGFLSRIGFKKKKKEKYIQNKIQNISITIDTRYFYFDIIQLFRDKKSLAIFNQAYIELKYLQSNRSHYYYIRKHFRQHRFLRRWK